MFELKMRQPFVPALGRLRMTPIRRARPTAILFFEFSALVTSLFVREFDGGMQGLGKRVIPDFFLSMF
jgi:hypothetical protein